MNVRCTYCGYFWQAEWEDRPSCKYNDPWPAPCEYDEDDTAWSEDYYGD